MPLLGGAHGQECSHMLDVRGVGGSGRTASSMLCEVGGLSPFPAGVVNTPVFQSDGGLL